jgi:hypothetical protein
MAQRWNAPTCLAIAERKLVDPLGDSISIEPIPSDGGNA